MSIYLYVVYSYNSWTEYLQQTAWPTKPQIFAVWPFTGIVSWPLPCMKRLQSSHHHPPGGKLYELLTECFWELKKFCRNGLIKSHFKLIGNVISSIGSNHSSLFPRLLIREYLSLLFFYLADRIEKMNLYKLSEWDIRKKVKSLFVLMHLLWVLVLPVFINILFELSHCCHE